MIVNITNGVVEVKEIYTRKLKKEITRILTENVDFDSLGVAKGFKPEAMDKANDTALIGMIEKITVNGAELPVTIETLDAMDARDVDKIISSIDEIRGDNRPLN